LYRDSHNKYSEEGSSKFFPNVDIQVQGFEVSNPEEYQRYESASKFFDLVKANCTCRFYKLVNLLLETFKSVAVRCTSIYFVCKLKSLLVA